LLRKASRRAAAAHEEDQLVLVQVHTDPNISSSPGLTAQVEALVSGQLERFAERISRVQVHLGDENSIKNGSGDKRCMMEARLDGRPPIAVTSHAGTLEQAMNAAAAKLERSIDNMLGRLNDR
jgi:ribosome-associated translation inhibitor RaiA